MGFKSVFVFSALSPLTIREVIRATSLKRQVNQAGLVETVTFPVECDPVV
jgi:hypothetical protein